MTFFTKTAIAATLTLGLFLLFTACTVVDKARDFSGEQVARAVEVECALSWPEREKNLEAVNRGLAARGLESRATALDCNGDGKPDF